MKLTALAILVTPTLVLMGAALAMMTDAGRSAMLNPAHTVLAKCCTPCRPPLTTTAAPLPD